MSQIIGSLYEVVEEIGSGGGGVVYLAKHLRLGKLIVLKADKRKLTTKREVLRREVDALKNLNHTYIPQVYDFLEENGTVYTVMDYIEGESLDKPLKRGESFTQPQVIEWACELLEALAYLHSRPPHGILHSDIKPANIMLTPQGDIRLIDFNIALALGEEGAVRVGFSSGYASPEHYGIEMSAISQTQGAEDDLITKVTTPAPETALEGEGEPPSNSPALSSSSSSTSGKRMVLLDARSDIYGLGATLYHLLSGVRPPNDAKAVEPLFGKKGISPAVAQIIQKAMEPDPAQRYQSALDMLYAFEHIHETDPRVIKHKRRFVITAASLAAIFLIGGISTFSGLKVMEQAQETARIAAEKAEADERAQKEKEQAAKEEERKAKEAEAAAKGSLELIGESQTAYQAGKMREAVGKATEAWHLSDVYSAQAQKALTDALGVYDLSDGYQPYLAIDLPSEPLKLQLSPNGKYVTALTSGQVNVFEAETGEMIAQLKADLSALSDMEFVDADTLLYAGDGALKAYSIAERRELWSGKPATAIAVSADRSTVAALYKDETSATVYNAKTGERKTSVDFMGKHQSVMVNDAYADPENTLFALSGDGHWLGVSFSDGALWAFDLLDSSNSIEIYDASQYTHFEGGFCGTQLAFASNSEKGSAFTVVDAAAAEQLGGFEDTAPFHAYADETGIYAATGNVVVKLDPLTGEQTEVAYTDTDITEFVVRDGYAIAASESGAYSFFDNTAQLMDTQKLEEGCDYVKLGGGYAAAASFNKPLLRLFKLVNHEDSQLCSYDPQFAHTEARVSSDGKTAMLFSDDAFRLYGMDDTLINETAIPDADQLYDQQYRRNENGSYLELIYYSGLIRRYSAEDGALLGEEQGEAPADLTSEAFETDKYRIESPLHGAPVAYDKATGEKIKELESDAYLTYVTPVGNCLMTEYVSAEGDRYGLLLDDKLETLAKLPNLCDVFGDGRLVFDDMRGNLRQSRIYSIEELLEMAGSEKPDDSTVKEGVAQVD